MALLLNVEANRELREGDAVRALVGANKGLVGTVVGVDLVSERPLAVQYARAARGGCLREFLEANDVEYLPSLSENSALLPLPNIRKLLMEGQSKWVSAGSNLCVAMEGETYTLVPKFGQNLKALSRAGSLEELLKVSFVTRRPHLVDSGRSRIVDSFLRPGVTPDEIISKLEA